MPEEPLSPEEQKIIEAVAKDIRVRGPVFRVLMSTMCSELSLGGPLIWAIRRALGLGFNVMPTSRVCRPLSKDPGTGDVLIPVDSLVQEMKDQRKKNESAV